LESRRGHHFKPLTFRGNRLASIYRERITGFSPVFQIVCAHQTRQLHKKNGKNAGEEGSLSATERVSGEEKFLNEIID